MDEFDEMREMLDADEERIDDLERQNEALQERTMRKKSRVG